MGKEEGEMALLTPPQKGLRTSLVRRQNGPAATRAAEKGRVP